MPEQQSQRGNPITEAAFTSPFQTPIYPMAGKLVLSKAVDALEPGEFSRLTNVFSWDQGTTREVQSRRGQVQWATGPETNIHTLVRVDFPANQTQTFFVGSGTVVASGPNGALGTVSTGYSGQPMTLLPYRPQQSGVPWVIAADSLKMAQIRASDGVEFPLGLPAPDFSAGAALAPENATPIADFTGDTDPAAWTSNPGFTYANPAEPTETPSTAGATGPEGQPAIAFIANAAAPVEAGYFVFWGAAMNRDLNVVGSVAADDDDYIHASLWFEHASLIEEFRVYFVVSEVFSESILPGAGNSGGANLDAYVKSFSQNDLATFISTQQTQVNAAETARLREVRDQSLRGRQAALARFRERTSPRPAQQDQTNVASVEASRSIAAQASAASEVWKTFGVVGIPLRRGDFQRLGQTEGRNWGTVTGMVVMARMAPGAGATSIRLSDLYLTGGSGPDTGDAATVPYDYRFTHYNTQTGDEGNPSPIMAEGDFIDSLRRGITVTPSAYGNAAIRQRFYRRGGTLPENWYYVGENTGDGSPFTDTESDFAIVAAGTVEIDHYEAVPSTSATGETVLAQPVPVVFGPYNGQLFALGDPNQPGHVYASIPDEPGHWPPDLVHEVCSPSEELMNGLMYGGQPYVFSRDNLFVLYPNLTGASGMTSQPTGCTRGLIARWGFTVGGGWIWFIAEDGVYRTQGGGQQKVSTDVDPLWLGQAKNGYLPVDYTQVAYLRCCWFDNELWVQYRDTGGQVNHLVYAPLSASWRHYRFAVPALALYDEQGGDGSVLQFGQAGGTGVYNHLGTSDAGTAIPGNIRTGSWDWGRPREEKIFGDQILDVDCQGTTVSVTNYLNSETNVNPAVPVSAGAGRVRMIIDGFGNGPQRARNLAVDLTWSTAAAPLSFYFVGTSITLQPDLTINRVTNWDDLGSPDESYITGVTFDVDTGGVDRTIIIERDFQGVITEVATLTVNADGRHKLKYTWAGTQANQIRVRPNDDCLAWLLYRADWIYEREPPRIAGWDIFFENGWDQYHTGLDLYCDTDGQTKQIRVEIDGQTQTNPATGQPYWEVVANGRQVVHLDLPWGRGHVYHFYATDPNPGILYTHRWHLVEEPSEQANWNQPFTILGTAADKWVKAVVLEVDTFGATKTVTLEADGAVVSTFPVTANGRQVVQIALPNGQQLGRVWRLWPTDSLPSRLYSVRPIFDEEPYALTIWNTQQVDHGYVGFHYLTELMITLKSNAPVELTITTYLNQTGTTITDSYTIPSTGGQKLKRWVPPVARKGVLYQYFLTCASAFWLYKEESHVTIQGWEGGSPKITNPFGNSDVDTPTRSMISAEAAAGRSGGGSGDR